MTGFFGTSSSRVSLSTEALKLIIEEINADAGGLLLNKLLDPLLKNIDNESLRPACISLMGDLCGRFGSLMKDTQKVVITKLMEYLENSSSLVKKNTFTAFIQLTPNLEETQFDTMIKSLVSFLEKTQKVESYLIRLKLLANMMFEFISFDLSYNTYIIHMI